MPAALGPLCDRVFLAKLGHEKAKNMSVKHQSVAFRTQYSNHYKLAGVAVPQRSL
jgi:hypothetical protein